MKKAALALSVILVLLVAQFATEEKGFIHVCFGADAHGNDVTHVEVHQWNGTDYVLRGNITVNGSSLRIFHNQTTKFVVGIKANVSLIPGVTSDYIKLFMNITHENSTMIWTNKPLNFSSNTTSSGFNYCIYEGIWNTSIPEEGVDYSCIVDYQAYY